MSVKNHSDLESEISLQVNTNGIEEITGAILGSILKDISDSGVNLLGDLSIQGKLGYSTLLSITSDGDITHKKYVDDAIAGAVPSGVLFAANNLSDLSNASTARTNLGVAIGSNVQAWSANLDSWSVLAPSTKLSVDGSLSMTGDLDLNSHDLKRVSQIKDTSGVVSLVPSTRLLKDSSGNTIAIWGSQTNGFGIQTASWAAYLKGTNLSQVSTFEFPNVVSGTLALTSDLTAYLPLSGGTLVGNLNGVTPTELGYISGATSSLQNQINNINAGLSWKPAVRVATTANITLSGAQTIDGIAVIAGDRVLVKNQSTASQNGIYVCASGAWTRAADSNTGATILQATVSVEEGSVNADTIYTCTTDAPITIGTTSIVFTKTSATTYTGSAGISLTGNNFTLDNSYFTGEVSLSGGAATLLNSAVIGKVLTGYVSGSGTISSSDTILQAIQKLNGNDALKISTSLNSANIIVGNVSNLAAAVSMSGDITIDNAGATTIGANKVTYTKSYNGNQLSIVNTFKILTGN